MPKLISFSGLPGVGKTTQARHLARRIKAIHLRVDSAEAAMKRSVLEINSAEDAGYLVLAALARDNLLLGFDVIVDTVNPIEITRKMWADCANRAKAALINIEVICADAQLHRRRVESRTSDIEGLILPTWDKVQMRQYEPWLEHRIVVDTSKQSVPDCVAEIMAKLG